MGCLQSQNMRPPPSSKERLVDLCAVNHGRIVRRLGSNISSIKDFIEVPDAKEFLQGFKHLNVYHGNKIFDPRRNMHIDGIFERMRDAGEMYQEGVCTSK